MHSTTCSIVNSPFHHHLNHRSNIRNPNFRLRAKSSILIPKQDTKLKAPFSDSISRRLILLRHAESSWEHPSLRGKALHFWVLKFQTLFNYERSRLRNLVEIDTGYVIAFSSR